MYIESFYITFPDKISAQKISQACLSNKLAACANVFPIDSLYEWEGKTQKDKEFVSILKTSCLKAKELADFIQLQHPYDVPCIIHYQVQANEAYGKWVEDVLKVDI